MRIFLALGTSLVLGLIAGPFIIKKLKEYKLGQQIRLEGPAEHLNKQGTPTMGGFIFIAATLAGALIWNRIHPQNLLLLMGMVLFGLIGLWDDTQKIKKAQSEGLSARQKILLNLFFGILMAVLLQIDAPDTLNVAIPFTQRSLLLPLWLFVPFIVLFYTAVTNSVNLADGIDGLCGSVSLIVSLFYVAYGLKTGSLTVAVFAAVLAGALLAYLAYNWHPARVFMGDTGSFALGGALATLSVLTHTELLFLLVGLIYVLESLTVILQVISFKTRGKRIFLMTPIHHHFEKKGWSEVKIVGLFSLFTLLCCLIAYVTLT
ncbi:Phospho-N-acetylmuramoyl-pentapeptide- transferase [Clostridiaceae bacterium JG1575]|nr:Phospho-N-acetylmuramoyl-pentapeptide- transferase [Clostridiaceae bacterium JG1575]